MTDEHHGKPLNAVINMRNSYADMGQKILEKGVILYKTWFCMEAAIHKKTTIKQCI